MGSRRLVLLVVVAGAALALVGCQQIAEQAVESATEAAIEDATGNKVDIEDGSVSIEGTDGASVNIGDSAQVPADFPTDVPVYEGTVKAAVTTPEGFNLALETRDAPQQVLDFYQTKLEADGWTKEVSVSTADGGTYGAKKGERTVQVVAALQRGDQTDVTVVSLTASK